MDEARRAIQRRLNAISFEASVQEYFEKHTRPKLEENERWRRESRRVEWPK